MRGVSVRRSFALLSFLGAGFVLWGEARAQTWVWSDARTIRYIYPASSGYIFNVYGANLALNSSCGTSFLIPAGAPEYEAKISTIMGGYFAGDIVKFVYDDAETGCTPAVERLLVERQ